jgi:hypothetical protein
VRTRKKGRETYLDSSVHRPCLIKSTTARTEGIREVNGAATEASPGLSIGVRVRVGVRVGVKVRVKVGVKVIVGVKARVGVGVRVTLA